MATHRGTTATTRSDARQVIAAAMRAHGMSCEELASKTGISAKRLTALFLDGKGVVLADEFLPICMALGLSIRNFDGARDASRGGTTWGTQEIRYLERHAGDGAEAIAEALGRSPEAVRHQANAYGISLRMRWQCPHCGQVTYKPLNGRTGWCHVCTMKARRMELEEEVREVEAEAKRELEERRKRQAIYSRKSRLKRSMRPVQSTGHLKEERGRAGLTLERAAARIGIAPEALAGYEERPLSMPIDLLIRAAELYDCGIGYLLGQTDERVPQQRKAGTHGGA